MLWVSGHNERSHPLFPHKIRQPPSFGGGRFLVQAGGGGVDSGLRGRWAMPLLTCPPRAYIPDGPMSKDDFLVRAEPVLGQPGGTGAP